MAFPTIDRSALVAVTGGRITHVDGSADKIAAALSGFGESIKACFQIKDQAKQRDDGMLQQVCQQVVEQRRRGRD